MNSAHAIETTNARGSAAQINGKQKLAFEVNRVANARRTERYAHGQENKLQKDSLAAKEARSVRGKLVDVADIALTLTCSLPTRRQCH